MSDSEHSNPKVLHLAFHEEILDLKTSQTFVEMVNRELAIDQGLIRVDCSELRFADSVGIGAIVSLYRKGSGRLKLQNVSNSFRQCLNRADSVVVSSILDEPVKESSSKHVLVIEPTRLSDELDA